MFCFAIVDDEGNLAHCSFAGGNDNHEKEYQMIDEGVYPIMLDAEGELPEGWFFTILSEDDLIEAFINSPDDRWPKDPEVLRIMLRDDESTYFDAIVIREEVKVTPNNKRRLVGLKDEPIFKKNFQAPIVRARDKRARMNEVTGLLIEDVENYDAIVARDKALAKEAQDKQNKLMATDIDEFELRIKSEMDQSLRAIIPLEVKEELDRSLREEIRRELTEEMMESIKEDLIEVIKEDLKDEVKEEFIRGLQAELKAEMLKELKKY